MCVCNIFVTQAPSSSERQDPEAFLGLLRLVTSTLRAACVLHCIVGACLVWANAAVFGTGTSAGADAVVSYAILALTVTVIGLPTKWQASSKH